MSPRSAGLEVRSSAFSEGEPIPERYSCDGKNVSPPLEWSVAPGEAKSLALVCDDPDAPSGRFTHWIVYDLAPTLRKVNEGSAGGGKEGINSFGKPGYGGPCPPPKDTAHHYIFRVYALDIASLGGTGLSKQDVEAAMKGHIVAEGQLTGIYQRRRK
jgi:Raf kinase inhibitor-like YbhB/YbcL family protein